MRIADMICRELCRYALEVLSNSGAVTCVNASGRITQSAFEAEDEPLAVKLGKDVYGGRLLLSLHGSDYLD